MFLSTKISYNKIIILLIIIFILFPSIYKEQIITIQQSPNSIINNDSTNGRNRDYCIFQLHPTLVSNLLKSPATITESIKRICLNKLPTNYMFLDYSYEIINSRLYTYHRDLTSSQSFQNLKYPSYTLIIYLYDGKFLNICPNSLQKFTVGKPFTIKGNKGTAVLFNSDMVHAANSYYTPYRHCIQYKICHSEDKKKLNHLMNQHIIKKQSKVSKISYLESYLSRLSHKYLLVNDLKIIGKLSERNNNNLISRICKTVFGLDFYNDT